MAELFDEHLCLSCHTLDGSDEEVAPSLKGLFGKSRTLTDGTTVVADEAYLRDSLLYPEKHVVEGYDPMPELDVIPEDDLQIMIDAMKKLGD